MKNFYKPGQLLSVIATAMMMAGRIYKVGELIGVAASTVEAGEPNELALGGAFRVPNPDGVIIAQGALVGYNKADHKIVAAGGGDFDIGHAFQPITATDTEAKVRLIGGSEASGY